MAARCLREALRGADTDHAEAGLRLVAQFVLAVTSALRNPQ